MRVTLGVEEYSFDIKPRWRGKENFDARALHTIECIWTEAENVSRADAKKIFSGRKRDERKKCLTFHFRAWRLNRTTPA